MNPFTSSVIPESYGQWKHCITVDCGIALTESFIKKRLEELQQSNHPQTQQFARLYGADYTTQVIGWFQRALNEIK
jgi:hypothetical protein